MNRATPALAALAALLLAAPIVQAHGAPVPRDYETRLLADCNDDWFAGDGVSARGGYDLHAVDVREAYTGGQHVLVFRTIMNGDGPLELTLSLSTSEGSKSIQWTTQNGASWSADKGSTDSMGINDGDRFALEGTVPRSALGLTVGDRITDYTLTSTIDGEDGDRIPGNDRPALAAGPCDPDDAPTSYKLTSGYTLEGPIQYARFPARDAGDCRAGSDLSTQRLLLDTQKFVDMVFCNTAGQNQEFTLSVQSVAGVEAEFHEPGTNRYTTTATTALQDGKGTLIHLALTASEPGSGVIKVTLTTDLGGRTVIDVPYEVADTGASPTASQSPTSGPTDEEPTPGLAPASIIGLMAALAVARRR